MRRPPADVRERKANFLPEDLGRRTMKSPPVYHGRALSKTGALKQLLAQDIKGFTKVISVN